MTDTIARGDWIQTYTGVAFYPLDPRPEDVRIEDIAHALALENRFPGTTRVPYSVAEHSVRVSEALDAHWPDATPDVLLAALLHDASEAYIVDVPRPIKASLVGYAEIEAHVTEAICARFGLTADVLGDPRIKQCDDDLLATEARDLLAALPPQPWNLRGVALPDAIIPWAWHNAEREFLLRWQHLVGLHTGSDPAKLRWAGR